MKIYLRVSSHMYMYRLRFRTIREIFTTAKNNQPCVVILESFECLSWRNESESENPRRLITEIAVQVGGTCLDNLK